MKWPLLLSIVVLPTMGVAAQSSRPAAQPNTEAANPLVGAWKLASLQEPAADGRPRAGSCTGMFVFTADGNAAVQVMCPDTQTSTAYAQNGYEASFGRYHIDGRSSTFTFHIDGALVRTLIGQDLKRAYQLSGNKLIVTSTDPNEHWKVVWERY